MSKENEDYQIPDIIKDKEEKTAYKRGRFFGKVGTALF